MKLHVGTSGFGHKEWKGKFYPPGQSPKKLLAYYAEHFEAVEINNTFLGLPTLSVLQAWASQVQAHFRFAFKAPRQITHSRRLKDVREPLHALLDRIGHLGDQAGPALFQLQSNFKKDLDRLRQFLAILPPTARRRSSSATPRGSRTTCWP